MLSVRSLLNEQAATNKAARKYSKSSDSSGSATSVKIPPGLNREQ